MNQNILFTCAGRRNYLINYFKAALKGHGQILAADMSFIAPAMAEADIAIKVSDIYSNTYFDELLDICKKYQVTAIISLNDLELPLLTARKAMFEAVGTKVLVSSEKVIEIGADKWETYKFLIEHGFKSPRTFIELDKAKEAIKKGEIQFPVVIKPRWGSASIGIDFAKNEDELELMYSLQSLKLKSTILANLSASDLDRAILIQEKLKGVEFGMDVVNDFDGNFVNCFTRQKLSMRAGETDKAKSVSGGGFVTVGKKLGETVKHIGNMDCDLFIEENGDMYVLELNPRFGGGYPFSHEAGANTVAAYISWLNGEKNVSKHFNYKEGLIFSKYDKLMPIKEV
mgnify:CR=1 FL=1